MPPKQPPYFLFTIFFLHSIVLTHQQLCDHQHQSSLLSFVANLSTSSSPPLNWSSSTNCCQWEGLNCDTNGRITSLQLPSRGLNGIITSSLGNLATLTTLILSNNSLHGPLGDEISRLSNLTTMDLSSNMFSGHIPTQIGNLLLLEILYLQDNNFTGPIPPSLMNCTNLVDIILRDNHLDGDISTLDFSKLLQLRTLDLLNNTLTGNLPESLFSCKSLIAIRVSENNLTGQISPKIVELESLSFLGISRNSFTNITKALTILARCKNLTYLAVEVNFYGESLPSPIDYFGTNIFPKLEILSLDSCNLSGSFPEWLSTIKTIRAVELNKNRFTGGIPNSIGSLPKLFFFSVHQNNLSGEIPPQLFQLPIMISDNLDPKYNQISTALEFFTHSAGGRRQYKTLPSQIDLSSNDLSGHIPSEIGNSRNLQRLYLADNSLSGHIPVNLSGLKRLELLHIQRNNLSGGIPESLKSLSFLSSLNVSYNNLEGQIPSGGQFDSFAPRNFEGNPLLCGEVINRSCSQGKGEVVKGGSGRKHWFLHGFFVGLVSGFFSILVFVASYVWIV